MNENEVKPLVSVIIPSYNHARFIEQTITSVFNQTYKNYEVFVIDDGSTDNSIEILKQLLSKFDFTLIQQENHGVAYTLNKGIELSGGKYFTFCASDDYWALDKLEKQVDFMERNPDIPMCYGKAYHVDENGNILPRSTKAKNKSLRGGNIFRDIILVNFHPPVNYLFKKEIFDTIGRYKNDMWTEDFYMNLKISKKYEIGFINSFISYYRVINNKKKALSHKIIYSHLDCIKLYKGNKLYKNAISRWHFRNFCTYCSYKDSKLFALTNMLKSLKYSFRYEFLQSIIKLFILWR